jgi:hypothetical protein
MKVTEETKLIGIFSLNIHDKNGKIIESFQEKNLIVTKGRENMSKLISASGNSYFVDEIGFGTDGTTPTAGDLVLTGSTTKAFDSITYPDPNSVEFNWSLGLSEANGMAIAEFGLISNNGDLFARKSRSVINKESDFSITGTWKIIF